MSPKVLCLFLVSGLGLAAEKYSGPLPPKPDIPYLLHADHLIETEIGQARQEGRKNETAYVIAGASSPARTPLAEPIFLIDVQQLSPDRVELYRLEVKNGNREVSLATRSHRGESSGPFHLMVTRLAEHLYRVEADEPLEDGEYALTPSGDNRVFCFEIY